MPDQELDGLRVPSHHSKDSDSLQKNTRRHWRAMRGIMRLVMHLPVSRSPVTKTRLSCSGKAVVPQQGCSAPARLQDTYRLTGHEARYHQDNPQQIPHLDSLHLAVA